MGRWQRRGVAAARERVTACCGAHHGCPAARVAWPALQAIAAIIEGDAEEWALAAFLAISYAHDMLEPEWWRAKNGTFARDPASASRALVLSTKYTKLVSPHAEIINAQMCNP